MTDDTRTDESSTAGTQAAHLRHPLEADRPVITPIYSQDEPSQPIQLGKFAAVLNNETCEATAVVRFNPRHQLCFMVTLKNRERKSLFSTLTDRAGVLTLPERYKIQFKASCISRTTNVDGAGTIEELNLTPTTLPLSLAPASTALVSAKFHVFNCPDFHGPEDYCITVKDDSHETSIRCGRAILRSAGWIITIAGTDHTRKLCKQLDESGGYVITHVGAIERADGSPFSSDQLEDLLLSLRYFLSFTLGRWTALAFPVGFDEKGERVFEQWGIPLSSSGAWTGSCSWFTDRAGGLLTEVFPGFWAMWKDQLWNRTIREAIYWYLEAHGRGTTIAIDTGLILTQAALERLAWTYCVEYRKMISEKAFGERGIQSADKLRLLASAMGIPLKIPVNLSALHAKRGGKWFDAMEAITTIRNDLVHPQKKTQLPDGSQYEAWKLSLWYLDLVFLHLCGHKGRYSNRLKVKWAGELDTVPWSVGSS